jgi:hypothetical protein
MITGDYGQWRSQPDDFISYTNFNSSSLFISLEIDCVDSLKHGNICIAGLNRRAGYIFRMDFIVNDLNTPK